MNTALGARIKSLRELKGFTQEQIADRMKCSRQKYARLEKGLIDITYSSISAIAAILGVNIEDITSAINTPQQPEPMYRVNDSINEIDKEDKFEFINNMLDVFYAHRKVYNSVKKADTHE
jgi:transcriptional regulator with XRE-family HTH domain